MSAQVCTEQAQSTQRTQRTSDTNIAHRHSMPGSESQQAGRMNAVQQTHGCAPTGAAAPAAPLLCVCECECLPARCESSRACSSGGAAPAALQGRAGQPSRRAGAAAAVGSCLEPHRRSQTRLGSAPPPASEVVMQFHIRGQSSGSCDPVPQTVQQSSRVHAAAQCMQQHMHQYMRISTSAVHVRQYMEAVHPPLSPIMSAYSMAWERSLMFQGLTRIAPAPAAAGWTRGDLAVC